MCCEHSASFHSCAAIRLTLLETKLNVILTQAVQLSAAAEINFAFHMYVLGAGWKWQGTLRLLIYWSWRGKMDFCYLDAWRHFVNWAIWFYRTTDEYESHDFSSLKLCHKYVTVRFFFCTNECVTHFQRLFVLLI